MSSFIYVLVFVTCSTVYHGCLTTTSDQLLLVVRNA